MTDINVAISEVLDTNDRATAAFSEAMAASNKLLRRLLAEWPSRDETEFMTMEQCSEFTKLPVSHLYKLTHTHSIPFIKRGRKLLFDKARVASWLREHQVRTTAEIVGVLHD